LLCVAKFFPGLDGLMPPLAGAEGASLASFFALDAVGSFLWSGFYVGVGYLFSEQRRRRFLLYQDKGLSREGLQIQWDR
jgi:membrane protein DedA with SNARE-associated domain